VALYPAAHPATAATLAHLANLTSSAHSSSPLTLTVLPDSLLLDGQRLARGDQAVGELAVLLHSHQIGELMIHPGGDADAWRSFLSLLARGPDEVRADGGIGRLWMTIGGWHVELREIDYADVLRERTGGQSATWELIVAAYLEGDARELNEETIRALAEIAQDPVQLSRLVEKVDERSATRVGLPARAAALISMLRGIDKAVTSTDTVRRDHVRRNMATALGQLSPDVMLEILAHCQDTGGDGANAPGIVDEVLRQMSDQAVASFLVKSVAKNGTATRLLVDAFHALVPEGERQRDVLSLAYIEAASSPMGQGNQFEAQWANVTATLMLDAYSSSLPDGYAPELSAARTQATAVERITDDPPERIAEWLNTVGPHAIRTLDLLLVQDLLDLEHDPERWRELMRPVVTLLDDLLLVGDFDAADQLVALLVREAGPTGSAARRAVAAETIEELADGPIMRHVVSHLVSLDEGQFERAKSLCTSFGERLVGPLAEALSTERGAKPRERLTQLLIAFGPTGRQAVERLRISPNGAVRRTAIYLLREFGGGDALPDLTLLLDDAEPQVQREAVRAILTIGSERAFDVLREALVSGTTQSQEAIMQVIGLARDKRAMAFLVYILRHIDHRGSLASVYLRAIDLLGALRDPEAIEPLREALYRGEWWAPRRTAVFRQAAAAGLARIATPEALNLLREAATSGSRGVRAAVRPALARAGRERP
jgi:HEAT repeat protein